MQRVQLAAFSRICLSDNVTTIDVDHHIQTQKLVPHLCREKVRSGVACSLRLARPRKKVSGDVPETFFIKLRVSELPALSPLQLSFDPHTQRIELDKTPCVSLVVCTTIIIKGRNLLIKQRIV